MNGLVRLWTWCGVLTVVAVCGLVSPLCTQSTAFAQAAAQAAAAKNGASTPQAGPYRQLAPGVMESVDLQPKVAESYSRHDVIELLAVDPNFEWSKDLAFRRDIWYLEFKFKPVRMLWVDMPQASGKMQRQLIWYLVYSVTNPGKALHPTEDADHTFKPVSVDKPTRFIPRFLLESHEFGKVYPDRVIPVAMGPIGSREDPRRTFHNSEAMSRQSIKVGQTLWGVATWENVDPRIDRFSIYASGLTNAYRWRDEPGVYQVGDPIGKGRRMASKTLKLNFWRPGDEYYQNEKEIRYGIPGEVDYEWVYQ